MSERAIRSVAVFGGGIVAWSAAIAFARALPGVRVALVETPPDPAALADRMPGTLPGVHRFHAAIGLDELDLVRAGIATHRLATRFERWSASGEPWYQLFGEVGFSAGPVAFHDMWLRARQAKRALPFHRYATAAVLAEAGRFVHPEEKAGSPLSTYLYGLFLDPDRYLSRLKPQGAAARVSVSAGEVAGTERREDGGIGAVLLSDGRRIEADLFLDATGPTAMLRSAVDTHFESWAAWMPADRLLLAWEKGPDLPPPSDTATATNAGWRFSAGVRGRRLQGFAFGSGATPDARAARIFSAEAGVEQAEAVAIRPGRRAEPWAANVLALGDAATAVDPLEWTGLHLAHSAILRALELLPGRDCHPLELAEYNRRTAEETLRVRDFIAVHYLRSGRTKGEFWEGLADREPPDSLARTLEQFEARGRLPFFEEESFDKESWASALIGMGVLPGRPNPAALALEAGEMAAGMKAFAERLAALPARMPSYADYLARMANVPSGSTSSRPGA